MKKYGYTKMIFLIFIIVLILYICHNSVDSSKQSFGESGKVLKFLNDFFMQTGIQLTFTQFIVRKLAHFTEYFILGTMFTVTIRIYTKKFGKYIFFELFVLLAIPVIDEYIQLFTGRTSSVEDVVLDFIGSLAGMGLCLLLIRLFDSIRLHRKAKG